MLNQILFGLIGLLMLGVAGTGTVAAYEKSNVQARGDNGRASQEVDVTVAASSDIDIDTQESAANPLTSIATITQSPRTVTECVTVRVDDDDEEWEGEESDDEDEDREERSRAQFEERCTTSVIDAGQGAVLSANQATQTPSPATSPKPVPTTPASTPAVKAYTLAEVGAHNSAANCWSAINGSVYNLTTFVSNHPGGSAAIKSLCGVDGTTAYNGQHGGVGRPASELVSLKIGVLVK